MAIRIRQKDIAQIDILNKKAKQKRNRIKRNYDINPNVTIRGIDTFRNREEFNLYISSLEDFTRRNNLNYQYKRLSNDVVISRREEQKFNMYSRRANENRRQELEKYRGLDYYEGSSVVGRIGEKDITGEVLDEINERHYDLNNYYSREAIQSKIATLEYQSRENYIQTVQEQHRINYASAILDTFGKMGKEISNIVLDMSQEDFNNLYYSNRIAHIGFIYERSDYEHKFNVLREFFNERKANV